MRIWEKTLKAIFYMGMVGFTLWFIHQLILPIFIDNPFSIQTIAFALIVSFFLIPLWAIMGVGFSAIFSAIGLIVGVIAEGINLLLRHNKQV